MDRWRGKVAVVTGASSGIGAAVVLALVKNGVNVVGIARRKDRVEALKTLAEGSGEILAVKADISKEEEIVEAFEVVKSQFGTVHILVNNAGIARPGRLSDQETKYLQEVLDVNVMGLTICTQQALKLMDEAGVNDGHIIHINSVVGHKVPGHPDQPQLISMYSASKYAVTALTETLRLELRFAKNNTKVTSISPGFVKTEMLMTSFGAVGGAQAADAVAEQFKDQVGLESEDIADAVIYALSTKPHAQVNEVTIRLVGELF